MNYNEALKSPCPRCDASIGEDCTNTQQRPVLPHKWRTEPSAAHLEPTKGLTLRQTLVLDLARKQIALYGPVSAFALDALYPKPNQYTNIINALSKLVELGYLAVGPKLNGSRSFILPADSGDN